MFAYTVNDKYLELTATGFVSADEAQATFRTIRADPAVPDHVPYLMDLRQYDHTSMSAEELKPRVLRMFEILGPRRLAPRAVGWWDSCNRSGTTCFR